MTWWCGFVAVIAGWVVTESGRQPWLVHGILRTADGELTAAELLGHREFSLTRLYESA